MPRCVVFDQKQTKPQVQKTDVQELLEHTELWGKASVTDLCEYRRTVALRIGRSAGSYASLY